MDTTNIILHLIALFRGQFNKTEANARGRGKLVGAKAEAEDKNFASRSVGLKWLRIYFLFLFIYTWKQLIKQFTQWT